MTVDRWLGRQARASFPELAATDSERATAGVIRLKRHPAVRAVLTDIAELSSRRAHREDLFELWGDTGLLDEIVSISAGDLQDREAREVHAHALIQFAEVDRNPDGGLMLGVGGRPLHLDTPLHDALTSDVEDYPVLFEIERLRGGHRGPRRYDHVLLDEAQEMAPLELATIAGAVRDGGALTVVGDSGQQVDPSAWFTGWDATLAELGAPSATRLVLRQSHRCPAGILALARAVRDQTDLPDAAGITRGRFDTHAAQQEGLRAWISSEPRITTAIVTPDDHSAQRLHREIGVAMPLVLASHHRIPTTGAYVTIATRLRGLEVGRVAVPDLDAVHWPNEPSNRNALYLAVSRATRAVWMSTVDPWSPLLEPPATDPYARCTTTSDRATQIR